MLKNSSIVLTVMIACGITLAPHVFAEVPRIPGDLLVQSNNQIIEYSPDNELVGQGTIPQGIGSTAQARDLAMDELGRVHVYNGTGDPVLQTFDQGTWSQQTALGWSTIANGSYGGIANFQNYVFVTDMDTGGDPEDEAQGVIRFDLVTGTWTRFAEDSAFVDLNIGLDGLLYALRYNGSSDGDRVLIYDPQTLVLLDNISINVELSTFARSVAADASGNIFVATWNSDLIKFNRDRIVLARVNTCDTVVFCRLSDIDIASDGRVAVSAGFDGVLLTDTDFTTFDVLLEDQGEFVSFVPDYDDDVDGIANSLDNCSSQSNEDQLDSDADGFGNICDTDLNNDCQTNAEDLGLLRLGFFGTDAVLDFNGDGAINFIDLGLMRLSFFNPPGPSGTTDCE